MPNQDAPQYRVDDRVLERYTTGTRETGTILEVYKFEEQYRYIVRFDDGTSGIFFGYDLLAVKDDPKAG